MSDNSKEKVVAITGASSGLGEATDRLLSGGRVTLVLGARRIKVYNELAIAADSFARAVALAMSQSEDVDVNEIRFRPTHRTFRRGKAARDWTFSVRVGTLSTVTSTVEKALPQL